MPTIPRAWPAWGETPVLLASRSQGWRLAQHSDEMLVGDGLAAAARSGRLHGVAAAACTQRDRDNRGPGAQ